MKFSNKNLRKTIIIILMALVFIGLTIFGARQLKETYGFGADSMISIIVSCIETAILLPTLIVAFFQLSGSKEIARATFITELNKSFVENKDYADVYNKLQNCRDESCQRGGCENRLDMNCPCQLDLTKGQISNYLTFFETIYILYKRGVVDFEILDDLFAYRFFLAVHSKVFQQKKLKTQPGNFKNIFCLEYLWLEYRKKINKKSDDPNNVYDNLLLKDLVKPDEYKRITKECRKRSDKE